MSLSSMFRAAFASLALMFAATAAQAEEHPTFTRDGYAVSGYDVVSYFQDTGPVRGQDAYTAEYNGATYRFASAENRDAFAADPAKFAPAYGGFCAYGLANGYLVPTDPEIYAVVDGVLYMNFNAGVQRRWEKNIPGYIKTSEHNWPLVVGYTPDELREIEVPGLILGPSD